jgi:hypothetical protein
MSASGTIQGNQTSHCESVTMTHENSGAVLVIRANRTQSSTTTTRARTRAGRRAIVNRVTAPSIRARRLCVILTCREGSNGNSCATVIASTRCAAQRRARWQPSAPFEWSPVVISETSMIVRSTRGLATYGTCANSGWLRRFGCLAHASTRSR